MNMHIVIREKEAPRFIDPMAFGLYEIVIRVTNTRMHVCTSTVAGKDKKRQDETRREEINKAVCQK